jgi:hypothetical protein
MKTSKFIFHRYLVAWWLNQLLALGSKIKCRYDSQKAVLKQPQSRRSATNGRLCFASRAP